MLIANLNMYRVISVEQPFPHAVKVGGSKHIRFKNVPAPYEVYTQLTQVGLSNKYLVNIAISVRRILLGFMIATLIGVPLVG